MGDLSIRLFPDDPRWQPGPDAAAAAAAYVAGLFAGPGDAVESVTPAFYDRVSLIDAGENTTGITCPACDGDIPLDWLWHLGGTLRDDLTVTVPCCGAVVAADTVRYDWPVGFARFEICAMNPTRAAYQLDARELAALADVLGHPVTQILCH